METIKGAAKKTIIDSASAMISSSPCPTNQMVFFLKTRHTHRILQIISTISETAEMLTHNQYKVSNYRPLLSFRYKTKITLGSLPYNLTYGSLQDIFNRHSVDDLFYIYGKSTGFRAAIIRSICLLFNIFHAQKDTNTNIRNDPAQVENLLKHAFQLILNCVERENDLTYRVAKTIQTKRVRSLDNIHSLCSEVMKVLKTIDGTKKHANNMHLIMHNISLESIHRAIVALIIWIATKDGYKENIGKKNNYFITENDSCLDELKNHFVDKKIGKYIASLATAAGYRKLSTQIISYYCWNGGDKELENQLYELTALINMKIIVSKEGLEAGHKLSIGIIETLTKAAQASTLCAKFIKSAQDNQEEGEKIKDIIYDCMRQQKKSISEIATKLENSIRDTPISKRKQDDTRYVNQIKKIITSIEEEIESLGRTTKTSETKLNPILPKKFRIKQDHNNIEKKSSRWASDAFESLLNAARKEHGPNKNPILQQYGYAILTITEPLIGLAKTLATNDETKGMDHNKETNTNIKECTGYLEELKTLTDNATCALTEQKLNPASQQLIEDAKAMATSCSLLTPHRKLAALFLLKSSAVHIMTKYIGLDSVTSGDATEILEECLRKKQLTTRKGGLALWPVE